MAQTHMITTHAFHTATYYPWTPLDLLNGLYITFITASGITLYSSSMYLAFSYAFTAPSFTLQQGANAVSLHTPMYTCAFK